VNIPDCGFESETGWNRTGNKNSHIYALIGKYIVIANIEWDLNFLV
jgi:hypothetical protein